MKTVPLGGAKAAGRVALVDDGDFDFVMGYRWHIQTTATPGLFYVLTNVHVDGRRTSRKMHTIITGWPITDHIDGDGLNNQRSNLRPATPGQNSRNSRRRRDSRSQFKGVFHDPSFSRRYRAHIRRDGRLRDLGWFDDEISAALAYDTAARELFGEYARLNFPDAHSNAPSSGIAPS